MTSADHPDTHPPRLSWQRLACVVALVAHAGLLSAESDPSPDDTGRAAGGEPAPDVVAEPTIKSDEPSDPAVVDEAAPGEELELSPLSVEPPPLARRSLDEHPCLDLKPAEEAVIDLTRRQLHQTLCGASLWFDGLFGEARNVEAARGAYGRLETSYTYSDFYGNKFRTRLDVRVDLPNLEERFTAFLGRDEENAFARDRSEGFALRSQFPSINDEDEWLAGLGYSLPENDRFSSDFRVGVRSLSNPRMFVRTRLRYNAFADENDLVHLRLTPFWNSRDRLGITPGVDYMRVLSARRLLRFSNLGTISQESRSFDWRSALILYQALREGQGIAFESFVRGSTRAEVSIGEFGTRAVHRLPLFKQRLFLESVIGYSWPKELRDQSREGSTLLAVGVELPFGQTTLQQNVDASVPEPGAELGSPSPVPSEGEDGDSSEIQAEPIPVE